MQITSEDMITDEQRNQFELLRETWSGSIELPLKGKHTASKKNKPRNVASRKPVKR